MFAKIKGLNINFNHTGTGPNLILLHGWQSSSAVFSPIIEQLKDKFTIWTIDLPGFGESDFPSEPWGNSEYVSLINEFLELNNIDHTYLVGHSFGGALAAMLTHQHSEKVAKLILLGTAGARRTSPKRLTYQCLASLGKLIFETPHLRKVKERARNKFYHCIVKETDYLTSGKLKETFKKVINRDLKNIYSHLKIPILIIWGEKDRVTPLEEGQQIHQLISHSQFEIINGGGHYVFLEKTEEFCKLLVNFLK